MNVARASSDVVRSSGAHRPPHLRRVAILGNVNVGKTTVFERLTRSNAQPVNLPGSTQVVTRGLLVLGQGAAPRPFRRHCASCAATVPWRRRSPVGACCENVGVEASCPALDARPGHAAATPCVTHLYDTPGSATLVAGSEDEMVSRDLLLGGLMDTALLVADAKNLRRSLALALQVAELGLPMVVDLNMIDEAESSGVEVDAGALGDVLGVEVVRTVAVEGVGVRSLADALVRARAPARRTRFPEGVEEALEALEQALRNPIVSARGIGILLLCGDEGARDFVRKRLGEQRLAEAEDLVARARGRFVTPLAVLVADAFHSEADRIARRVAERRGRSPSVLVRLGGLVQRPIPGVVAALLVIVAAYFWIGAFGATFVVDALAEHVFDGFLVPQSERLGAHIPSDFARDALLDPDFGLLPTGLFLAFGLVFPVLFCFYLFQGVLEDSGYLPRLSVLFDRVMRRIGLNGQGLIPLVLGFSCVTMAVITTRMLPTRRERVILTLLLTLGIPCAPLLATMLVILGHLPWTATAVVALAVGSQTFLAGWGASKVFPGGLSDLIIEIPPMRIPRPRILVVRTWRRTWQFMREAVPVFLAASFVVFVFDRAGGLSVVERVAEPLVNGLLGLPDSSVQVFIKTAIRREAGAGELNVVRDGFTNLQLVVTMVVMVFLVPCINTVIVVFKEHGARTASAILGFVVAYAIAFGGLLRLACTLAGIDFV